MADDLANALKPGTEFEGYRFEAVLGAGGFGITYRALEPMLDRHVAIKEYLPSGMALRGADGLEVRPLGSAHVADFQWGMDRFRTEAQTLVSFRHPHIVSVHRYFEANNTGYLVMDYVEGQTLSGALAPDRSLPEDELRAMMTVLLDGLSAVHARGFLHRDIKPANIILRDTEGGGRQPVLIDFGAARLALGQQSKSLTAIISEGYAPYEQYDSSGEQGAWTDIYAIGGVMYRCVTGRRPPDSPSRISALVRGRDDPMVPAAEAATGDYSPALLAAIDAALAVREDDRPQSIEALTALMDAAGAPDAAAAAGNAAPESPADETRIAGAPAPPPAPSGRPADAANETLFAGQAPAAPPQTTVDPTPVASPPPAGAPPAAPAARTGNGSRGRKPLVLAGVAVAALAIGGGVWAVTSGGGGTGQGGDAAATSDDPVARLVANPPRLIWKTEIGDQHYNRILRLFPSPDGGVMVAGIWHLILNQKASEKRNKYRESAVWFTKIDGNGRLSDQRRNQFKGWETHPAMILRAKKDGTYAAIGVVNRIASISDGEKRPRGIFRADYYRDGEQNSLSEKFLKQEGLLFIRGAAMDADGIWHVLRVVQGGIEYARPFKGTPWMKLALEPFETMGGIHLHVPKDRSPMAVGFIQPRATKSGEQESVGSYLFAIKFDPYGKTVWKKRYRFRKYTTVDHAFFLPDGSVQILCNSFDVHWKTLEKQKSFARDTRNCFLHLGGDGRETRRREFPQNLTFFVNDGVRLADSGHLIVAGGRITGIGDKENIAPVLLIIGPDGRIIRAHTFPKLQEQGAFGRLALSGAGDFYLSMSAEKNGKKSPGRINIYHLRFSPPGRR